MIVKIWAKDTCGVPIGVVKLIGPHRPKEKQQPKAPKEQGHRDQQDQNIHRVPLFQPQRVQRDRDG